MIDDMGLCQSNTVQEVYLYRSSWTLISHYLPTHLPHEKVRPMMPMNSDIICFSLSQCHLRRAILEIIASGIAQTEKDLAHFFKCTLLDLVHRHQMLSLNGIHTTGAENDANSTHVALEHSDPIKNSMQFLEQYEFIRIHFNEDKQENTYIATRLGYACLGELSSSKIDNFVG